MQIKHRLTTASTAVTAAFHRKPWLHYAVVYAIPMLFCLIDKLFALPWILKVNAADDERTARIKSSGIFLGLLEDFVIITLLVWLLLLVDVISKTLSHFVRVYNPRVMRILALVGKTLKFLVVLALVALALAPFAADMLMMRSREMRFTMDLITTYFREKEEASAVQIDPREVRLAKETIVGTAFISLLFAVVYVWYIDLTYVITRRAPRSSSSQATAGDASGCGFAGTPSASYGFAPLKSSVGGDLELADQHTPKDHHDTHSTTKGFETDDDVALVPLSTAEQQPNDAPIVMDNNDDEGQGHPTNEAKAMTPRPPRTHGRVALLVLAAFIVYILLILITKSISHKVSPLIAAIALNASLNEYFYALFNVQFQRGAGPSAITSAASYLQAGTEVYTLFQDDVLYRRTTGYKGDLAFDVQVDQKDLPNVLVIGVESYRYLDSLYLAMDTTAGAVMQKNNLSLTPQFDRWAKKGIAFNNMWSSWQTSRSLEAILFGQVNYDSVATTGTTKGREDTKLAGMPQFFKQKGYETHFTSGTNIKYDQWDEFLPSHGFDDALGEPEFREIAERDYNISKTDWNTDRRDYQWGVHDDLSFAILGDMLLKKTHDQHKRRKGEDDKKPFFHTHYTISSHMPFESYPKWFEKVEKPDFSVLCEGQSECALIKKYATLRYFTDMELGKFMDRMEAKGVLKDTIVLVVGDHGQSPEYGISTPYMRQTECQHVASMMVAQGRLGKHAGMVVSDATQQYDLLNTMADIIGLPEGGFLQTSVGRSLKRKVPFGSRGVWSNNPFKKMSLVQGHERFVFDRTLDDMALYDTIKDPLEKKDLLPSRTKEEAAKWKDVRTAGRTLSTYFQKRWDGKCIAAVSC